MPYFDHNATTPLAPAAREAWLKAQDEAWANPASGYRAGTRVKVRFDAARERLARVLDVDADRIVFTSGATEAAVAVWRHLGATLPGDARVAVNVTEHPCVREAARAVFGETVEAGGRVVPLPVDGDGVVSLAAVDAALRDGVRAVAVMAANNETGVLQPWGEIARRCRAAGAALVCDASQWLGKLPGAGLGAADWVLGTGHKFGAPKGVGLVLRAREANGFQVQPGGGQQRGHRAGTEDYAAAAALVAALVDAEQTKVLLETERLRWREQFEEEVAAALPGAMIVGAGAERLWNTVALAMPVGESERWITRLDRRGCEVSAGAACAKGGPSPVLAAMGVPEAVARRVIRVSAGWATRPEDWTALGEALVATAPEVTPAAGVVVPE